MADGENCRISSPVLIFILTTLKARNLRNMNSLKKIINPMSTQPFYEACLYLFKKSVARGPLLYISASSLTSGLAQASPGRRPCPRTWHYEDVCPSQLRSGTGKAAQTPAGPGDPPHESRAQTLRTDARGGPPTQWRGRVRNETHAAGSRAPPSLRRQAKPELTSPLR